MSDNRPDTPAFSSMFMQDANGTSVELVPVLGLWWDPDDRHAGHTEGRAYTRPDRLQPDHQPLYRVVYPSEPTTPTDPEGP